MSCAKAKTGLRIFWSWALDTLFFGFVLTIVGGVCMDIVGFAASIYRRRTPYIRVPTTVMGYVDASIGAKTGVNFVGHKNKLGAYIPPVLTLLDRSFLGTLDQRQLS